MSELKDEKLKGVPCHCSIWSVFMAFLHIHCSCREALLAVFHLLKKDNGVTYRDFVRFMEKFKPLLRKLLTLLKHMNTSQDILSSPTFL